MAVGLAQGLETDAWGIEPLFFSSQLVRSNSFNLRESRIMQVVAQGKQKSKNGEVSWNEY